MSRNGVKLPGLTANSKVTWTSGRAETLESWEEGPLTGGSMDEVQSAQDMGALWRTGGLWAVVALQWRLNPACVLHYYPSQRSSFNKDLEWRERVSELLLLFFSEKLQAKQNLHAIFFFSVLSGSADEPTQICHLSPPLLPSGFIKHLDSLFSFIASLSHPERFIVFTNKGSKAGRWRDKIATMCYCRAGFSLLSVNWGFVLQMFHHKIPKRLWRIHKNLFLFVSHLIDFLSANFSLTLKFISHCCVCLCESLAKYLMNHQTHFNKIHTQMVASRGRLGVRCAVFHI